MEIHSPIELCQDSSRVLIAVICSRATRLGMPRRGEWEAGSVTDSLGLVSSQRSSSAAFFHIELKW
jgi:hypothetical protein